MQITKTLIYLTIFFSFVIIVCNQPESLRVFSGFLLEHKKGRYCWSAGLLNLYYFSYLLWQLVLEAKVHSNDCEIVRLGKYAVSTAISPGLISWSWLTCAASTTTIPFEAVISTATLYAAFCPSLAMKLITYCWPVLVMAHCCLFILLWAGAFSFLQEIKESKMSKGVIHFLRNQI